MLPGCCSAGGSRSESLFDLSNGRGHTLALVRCQSYETQSRKAGATRRARPLDLPGRLNPCFHLLVQLCHEFLSLLAAAGELMTESVEMVVQRKGSNEHAVLKVLRFGRTLFKSRYSFVNKSSIPACAVERS